MIGAVGEHSKALSEPCSFLVKDSGNCGQLDPFLTSLSCFNHRGT